MQSAPDEVCGGLAFISAPPEEFVPEPVRGRPAIVVLVLYAGPAAEGEPAFRALREEVPPAIDLTGPMPYVAVQQLLDPPNPKGMHNYWTGDFLAEFPDEAVEAWVDAVQPPTSPLTQMIVVAGGGAIADISDEATAFGNRQSPFNLHMLSM